MTTLSTEDASKATASGMTQVSREQLTFDMQLANFDGCVQIDTQGGILAGKWVIITGD